MNWTDIQSAWHDLVDRILAQWPQTTPERVLAIAGDRGQFTRYIAESHDLTLSEATEAVEMWMYQVMHRRPVR